MKRLFKQAFVLLALGFITTTLTVNKAQAQPGVSISYQEFYDELSPYGQWVEDPSYGYVWVPYVDEDFRPYYTRGHWVMTEFGNTWVSDYSWGWAPFHYGRWTYDDYYGWVWIPGNEWGPAWVSWRDGGGYYGWAPLGPGFNISIGFGRGYNCPDDWWVFIPPRYIYEPNHYRYWEPRNNVNIIHNTTIINNTYITNNNTYIIGPRANEVERYTNRPVQVYHLNSATTPGSTNINSRNITMFRPMQVTTTTRYGGRPAPTTAIAAPRIIGKPQQVTGNTHPQFRTQAQSNAPMQAVPGNHPVNQQPQMHSTNGWRPPIQPAAPPARHSIQAQQPATSAPAPQRTVTPQQPAWQNRYYRPELHPEDQPTPQPRQQPQPAQRGSNQFQQNGRQPSAPTQQFNRPMPQQQPQQRPQQPAPAQNYRPSPPPPQQHFNPPPAQQPHANPAPQQRFNPPPAQHQAPAAQPQQRR